MTPTLKFPYYCSEFYGGVINRYILDKGLEEGGLIISLNYSILHLNLKIFLGGVGGGKG